MTDRASWTATTHIWASDVDPDHLARVRKELSAPGVAGGVRHLVLEVLAYADDEAASRGEVGHATVTHHPDGSVSIADDGRGTDTRFDDHGRVVRKPVMATADIRFTDPATAPQLPDGLPRRGMSSVAALSSRLTHENHRAGGHWSQTYRFGIPEHELRPVEERDHSGTTVILLADIDGPDRLTAADLSTFAHLEIELH